MGWNVFVGRQPIFDRNGNIYAYELLHRNSEQNKFPDVSPEKATLELLINTFLNIGFDDVSNRTKLFINFNDKLIYEESISQLDTQYIVIELLEDVEITPMLISRLKYFKQLGFKIALDDFVIDRQHELYDDLYKMVYIIKVDFKNTTLNDRNRIEQLTNKYPHLSLLAEKVETRDEYEEALRKGYGLFQGYYFAKPEIIKGKDILTDYTLYLYLFKLLNEEEPDIDKITDTIKRDVALSYKLLRYINSFAFDVPNKISSIKQAIMIMGLNSAKKWIQILVLYDIGDGPSKGREKALIEHSLARAKACELVAGQLGIRNTDSYFLLGMFSLLNVIMERHWEDILPKVSLMDDVEATLMGKETAMQPVLQLIEAIEVIDMPKIKQYGAKLGISIEKLSEIAIEAYRWVLKFEK